MSAPTTTSPGALPLSPPVPGPYCSTTAPAEEHVLRDLYAVARRNHRSLPPSHPARLASAELARFLRHLLLRGVPAARLAALFDPPPTHQAVRARAGAAGPRTGPPPAPAPDFSRLPSSPVPFPGTSLVSDAPYRRVLVHPSPTRSRVPLPSLPVLASSATDAPLLLAWLSAPERAPTALFVDDGLIHLYLTRAPTGKTEENPR